MLVSCNVRYQYSQPRPGDDASSTVVRRTGTLVLSGQVPKKFDPANMVLKPYVEMRISGSQVYDPNDSSKRIPGPWAKFYLGEFTTLAPSKHIPESLNVKYTHRLVDRIQRYAEAHTDDWLTIDIESNVRQEVIRILREQFGETKFNFPATADLPSKTDPTLDFDMVFPANTPWLEVINKMLESVGWDNLSINAEGENSSQPANYLRGVEWDYPKDTPIVATADVEPFVGVIPNRLVFKARQGPSLPEEGNGIFTVNNYKVGPLSIEGRGGDIVLEEIELDVATQEELQAIGLSIAEVRFRGGGDVVRLKVALNPLHDDKDLVVISRKYGVVEEDDDPQRFWVSGWEIRLTDKIQDYATMNLTLEAAIATDSLFSYNIFGVLGKIGQTKNPSTLAGAPPYIPRPLTKKRIRTLGNNSWPIVAGHRLGVGKQR